MSQRTTQVSKTNLRHPFPWLRSIALTLFPVLLFLSADSRIGFSELVAYHTAVIKRADSEYSDGARNLPGYGRDW